MKLTLTLCVCLLAVCRPAAAALVGPYAPDAQTLHLWHLDEAAMPVSDAVASGGTTLRGLGGGATLNNASFAGFGTALNTVDGGPADVTGAGRDAYLSALTLVNSTADNVAITYADPTTGAFTIEALLHIQFDPAVNFGTVANGGNGRGAGFQIVSAEDEANAGRIFQFRLDGIGVLGVSSPAQPSLEFINVRQATAGQVQNIVIPIPVDGPDAIALNNWYHVAVTYDGNQNTPDNLKFYWTLLDPSRAAANLIGTATLVNDLAVANTDFAIGNIGRNPSQNAFLGLIDEVRISRIARGADQMQFRSDAIVISAQPTNQTVGLGQPASFAVVASGAPPLFFQWRLGGVPIPNATNTTLDIPAAQLADAGDYDVMITNAAESVASDLATLTVRTPRNLSWEGSFTAEWDSFEYNWLDVDDNFNFATFGPGDHVSFNDANGFFTRDITAIEQVRPGRIVVDTEFFFILKSFSAAGGIALADSLTKRGSGTLTLGLNNSYAGPTIIEAGTLTVGDGATRGTLGTGPVTNHGALVFHRTDGLVVNGPITGSGSLTKDGTGTTTLRGINDWTGATLINAGTLQIGDGGAAGIGSGPIANNGVLTLNASNALAIATAITGSGALNQNGSGELTLTGANDYAGLTAVNGGTLVAAHDSALGLASSNTVIAGGTATSQVALPGGITTMEPFRLGGRQPVPNLSGVAAHLINLSGTNTLAGDITTETGGNQYNVESAAGRLVVAGNYSQFTGTGERFLNLQGAGNGLWTGAINNGTAITVVTKRGTGTWTLAGINGYSGSTAVSNGTLLVNGQIGSGTNAVLAYAGATLGGTGLISGPVTLGPGATLAPGAPGAGTLTILGALTLDAASVTTIEIDRAAGTYDRVADVTAVVLGGTLNVTLVSGDLMENDAFQLFSATTYGGTFATVNLPTLAAGLAWDTHTLGSDGTLRVIKVVTSQPGFGNVSVADGTIVFAGTNGVPGTPFVVLGSANIVAPLSLWSVVTNGVFDAHGTFAVTNAISPSEPQKFYILRQP